MTYSELNQQRKRDRRDYDEVLADVVEIRSLFPCSESPVSSGLMNYFHQGSFESVGTMAVVRVYIKSLFKTFSLSQLT